MPFAEDEVRGYLTCGTDPVTGRPSGGFAWYVDADALRRLGLHPDQPLSRVHGPVPPLWRALLDARRFFG